MTNRVEWHVAEGDEFEPIKHIATVRGKARYVLLGERVALNILARCSGISTACVFEWSSSGQGLMIRVTARSTSRTWHRAMASAASLQARARQRLVLSCGNLVPHLTYLQIEIGFRLVEKYGMLVGGIDPHRFDLSSMIMLKDNHIWSAGKTFLTFAIFPL